MRFSYMTSIYFIRGGKCRLRCLLLSQKKESANAYALRNLYFVCFVKCIKTKTIEIDAIKH